MDDGEDAASEYIVQAGDSVDSIAFARGFFPGTLWDDPRNAELKRLRVDRNVLMPGDRLVIPAKKNKTASVATGATHQFKRRGVPAVFRFQLIQDGQPRADQPYTLLLNGASRAGRTNANGLIEQFVPPDLREVTLVLGDGEAEYQIALGDLNPVSEPSGVKQRLANLGYDCDSSDDAIDERTQIAIAAFQDDYELPSTGKLDERTRQKLAEVHDEHK
jgi:hypothetical protein